MKYFTIRTSIVALAAIALVSCEATDYKDTSATASTDTTAVKVVEGYLLDSTEMVDASNARNSLDVIGVYQGTTPCADCEGIETTVQLLDSTYKTTLVYKGKSTKAFEQTGSWKWVNGSTIELQDAKAALKYFVAENKLIQLDGDGNKITGELAAKYILAKTK